MCPSQGVWKVFSGKSTDMADSSLLRLISGKSGDRAHSECRTFEQQWQDSHSELVRYVHSRVESKVDVEDIIQETLTRLLRYRDNPGIQNVRLMLFRIANNVLADYYRRDQRQRTRDHVALELAGPMQAPDRPHADRVAYEQTMESLMRAIARLPPKCRFAFTMSRFDALPHKEIARRMGISVKAVDKHIARAMLACKLAVQNQNI